jgi:hypothetical protein
MKTHTPSQLNQMDVSNIEYVSDKMYPKSQAIRRAQGNMPKDLTPNGTLALEVHVVTSNFSKRAVNRYMVINIVPHNNRKTST